MIFILSFLPSHFLFGILVYIYKIKKKNERKSDSILMDDEEDSIALRMKRNERRINQQLDGDDDENTSYEY